MHQETKTQLELPINRDQEPDRNHQRGGRSFYFFDFDDNVLFLATSIYLFKKESGEEVSISTGEYARWSHTVGRVGPYKDYEIRLDDRIGSFRRFRDINYKLLESDIIGHQPFIEDLAAALGQPDYVWKGPSWHTFYHASYNSRPLSVITARGHSPETLKDGIRLLVREKHLPAEPNYLSLFPVSHPEIRLKLGDTEKKLSTAELKERAIMESVEEAMRVYGENSHHRFGMSDDDPRNIELIVKAMQKMKSKYPENSFFVIDTHQEKYVKQEVFVDQIRSEYWSQGERKSDQLTML